MKTKLKIYTVDFGWKGSIVVVAENEAQARSFMQGHHNYKYADGDNCEITECKIEKGFAWVDYGDC